MFEYYLKFTLVHLYLINSWLLEVWVVYVSTTKNMLKEWVIWNNFMKFNQLNENENYWVRFLLLFCLGDLKQNLSV